MKNHMITDFFTHVVTPDPHGYEGATATYIRRAKVPWCMYA